MVNFGERLGSSCYKPWKDYYINYNLLKHAITSKLREREKEQRNDELSGALTESNSNGSLQRSNKLSRSASSISELVKNVSESFLCVISNDRQNKTDQDPFRIQLDAEIEKCVLFFLQTQGSLAGELARLRQQQSDCKNVGNREFDCVDYVNAYREVGENLLRLVKFAELNVTAISKILKKHDKHFLGSQLSDEYFSLDAIFGTKDNEFQQDKPLEQFYHFGGLSALVGTLRQGLLDVVGEKTQLANEELELNYGLDLMDPQENVAQDLADPCKDAFMEVEPIFHHIERARLRLKQASSYEQKLATLSYVYFQEPPSSEEGEEMTSLNMAFDDEKRQRSQISRHLNIISTFLYMTNYYIVAPNCGRYAAMVGGSEADTGMIIGMTPLAAQFGAILYSWWANKSYKSPLMFAAAVSSVGNILYALALPFDSFKMILVSRLLNGLGGARAINRRYIADGYSIDERTAAGATFIIGSALGMSAGPFINAIIEFVVDDDGYFTRETAPGYIMAIMWIVYLICVLYFFQDPEVLQQRKQESPKKSHDPEKILLLPKVSLEKKKKNSLQVPPQNTSILSSMWSNIPVMTTLLVYFVLKAVIEGVMSSTSMVTKHYFGWPSSIVGIYMSILGLLMFPTNLLVARYSRFYQDRTLISFFLITTLIGVFWLIYYPGETYSRTQYVIGSVIAFCSTNSLEGVNLSLLSKTIPKSWARHGILNSGLLATEFGTFGRTFAAYFLTWVAHQYGIGSFLDYAFIPVGILLILVIITVYNTFDRLLPIIDDDDEWNDKKKESER